MKKLFIPLVTLFLAVGLGSCDKINELSQVDIPFEISSPNITLTPDLAKKGTLTFNKRGEIDIFQGDLGEYKNLADKLKEFKTKKLSITINKINGSSTGSLTFGPNTYAKISSSDGKYEVSIPLSNLPIILHREFSLPQAYLKVVNSILNKKKAFKYSISGSFSKAVTSVEVKINIDGEVTAQVLDL
jgi:hypothetical protein